MATQPKYAAAAVILSDHEASEVLMVRRNDTLRFMPGHHAFPGGRIDSEEGGRHVVGAASDEGAVALHAVAREVFEETGLLCTQGDLPDEALILAARHRVLADPAAFDVFLGAHRLKIYAGDFLDAGDWVTPVLSPIRFHTRYYVHLYIGPQRPTVIEGELTEVEWMSPAEARRRWREGQLKLSTPVAFVLRNLTMRVLPEVLPYLQRTSHPPNPTSLGIFELRCGVFILPLVTETLPPATHTNCIIVGERELLVIDPGTDAPAELAHLTDFLDATIKAGSRVVGIALTHSHPDHTRGARALRERYDAPILAHAETARQVDFAVDRLLEDNEVLSLTGEPPWDLRCIHTPGHDPGHICFHEPSTRTLIAGDLIANPGTVVIAPGMGGNMGDYLQSLERVCALDMGMLLAAHGLPVGKPCQRLRETLEHRHQREAKVQAVWDEGYHRIDEILPRVYHDVATDLWPFAKHTLEAHLIHLDLPYKSDEETNGLFHG